MDEAEARTIVKTMIRVIAILDDSLHGLGGRLDEASYASYKAQAAQIMGDVVMDVLAGIYQQYPNLEARTADEWRRMGALDEPYWLAGITNTGKQA